MMYDIIVFEDFLFMRPHENDKLSFSRNFAVGTVFENLRFWFPKIPFTCGRKAKRRKKSPFSRKYQDRCARDLNSLRSKRFRAVSRVKDRAKNGPSPSLLFHFWALVSFLARPKPRIPFLGLSLLRNSTETLATQARTLKVAVSTVPSDKGIGQI